MSKTKFKIVQDTREKKPWQFGTIGSLEGVVVKKLDTGDYSIEGMEELFMLERKASANELFVNLGVHWERFEREMERAKPYKYKYLVIEALLPELYKGSKYSKMSGKFIVARIFYIQHKYGVIPLFVGKSPYTTTLITQLMKSAISAEKRCQ